MSSSAAGWSSGHGDEPFIAVHGLSKAFPLGQRSVQALVAVDLTIHQGEFMIVMGPSGSGKSTLLNLIGGLDRPSSGSIDVGGQRISELDEIGLAQFRRRTVGFVFQSFNLIPTMTARQNVEFPMMFAGRPGAERRTVAESLLRRVGLGDRMDHRPVELSGGEQQRVAIARSLANEPPLLLGDEPTGNLDTHTGREVMDLLAELNQGGRTMIVVTHDPRLEAYASRTVHMRDGTVVTEAEARSLDAEVMPS